MLINTTLINSAMDVAQEIFSAQTTQEFQELKDHFGKAYNETKIISEIAVKLILRIAGVEMQVSRDLNPVTPLVHDAERLYRQRYHVE